MMDEVSEAIIAGIVVASIVVLSKSILDYLATNKIIKFLQSSGENKSYKYRSSQAISVETNIAEDRVQRLCNRCKQIKRSSRNNESWRLGRK